MSEQLVFEDVMKDNYKPIIINKEDYDDIFRKQFGLIGENRRLKKQLADSDSLIDEILNSLNHGPDNELVRQAIDIYNQKWYGDRRYG